MSDLLARQRSAFESDPGSDVAFEALEEHHFVAGEWQALVELYQRRASAARVRQDPKLHAAVLFRLGQVLEQRCGDPNAALEQYLQVALLQPQHRAALHQARQICTAQSNWGQALQVAELEEKLPLEPAELGALLAEIGEIWRGPLRSAERALPYFERALQISGSHEAALHGRVRALESVGRLADAAQSWERLAELRRGPERAAALVAAAQLWAGPLREPERATELYRRALTHDPHHAQAVETLAMHAAAHKQWHLLTDLLERRFDREPEPQRRASLAAEIGQLYLQCLDQPEAAQLWLARADELYPDDLSIHYALAKLARHVGDREKLSAVLERTLALAGERAPARLLLEAGELQLERGDADRALALLRDAQARAGRDREVLRGIARALLRLDRAAEAAELLETCAGLEGVDRRAAAQCWSELGDVYRDRLDDVDSAREAFARAFETDPALPAAAAHLAELLRKREEWEPLLELLDRARRQGPEAERAAHHCAFAALLIEHFHELERARSALELALALDPQHVPALAGLQSLARASGDRDAWLEAARREAELSRDAARLDALVRELVPELRARGELRAALHWIERLLEVCPEDRSALETGVALQAELGAHAGELAWLERLQPQLEAPEQAGARRRRAVLLDLLGRSDEALHAYESVLEADPDDADALRALESKYASAGARDALLRVKRRRLPLLAPAERAQSLSDLARVLEDQLGDLDGALEALRELERSEAEPAATQARIARILERSGRFAELEQHLEHSAHASDTEVRLRRASLCRDRLGAVERAIEIYRGILAADPACAPARAELERTLRAGHDRAALVQFLEASARGERAPAERARLLFELAELREELGEPGAAREAYAEIAGAALDPELAPRAAERLESLLERASEWPELRAQLERRLGRGGRALELELRERLAELCLSKLQDPASACAHLEALGQLAPERTDVWRRLVSLHSEPRRPRELVRAIDAELACGVDAAREQVLRTLAARLYREAHEDARAASHYARALELDPHHAEACEYLADHCEREARWSDAVSLLERQLDEPGTPAAPAQVQEAVDPVGRRTALRLRISAIQAGALKDGAGAIRTLEAALAEDGPRAAIAEPLAELYERSGSSEALVALCERAAQAVETAAERTGWQLRLARALQGRSDAASRVRAAGVYRAALAARPDDARAEQELCDLLGELGDSKGRAALLEARLARARRGAALESGESEIALRAQLAELYCGPLHAHERALEHCAEILALEPLHEAARERALALAERLGRHDEQLRWIDARLALAAPPSERAAWLERRGDLLAGPLARAEEAVGAYSEALELEPGRSRSAAQLRALLESLGRWDAVLRCLERAAQSAEGAALARILDDGANLAEAQISRDAALPWLERLHAVRPDDPTVLRRIADIQRKAGRSGALLVALEAALRLTQDAEPLRRLSLERARLLESELGLPACAIAPLEKARARLPGDAQILAELERLYGRTGRLRERAELIEERLAGLPETAARERAELHRSAAELWSGPLADPKRAVPHLMHAAARLEPGSAEHRQALQSLQSALAVTGRADLWSQAAEEELRWLPAENRARRVRLRAELAQAYAFRLARPDAALCHLRAIVDRDARADGPDGELLADECARGEQQLLALLRACGDPWELERRLSARLLHHEGSAAEWLELAWLRKGSLRARAQARDAYRQALARGPGDRIVLRELRQVCEEIADWPCVAESLELELAQCDVGAERPALLRTLGAIYSQRLGDPDGAIRSYSAALEADPGDLEALHALGRLRRTRREWREELALCEREIALLADREPAQRQALWLRIAALARGPEPARARAAYAQAAALGELAAAALREWAEVCRGPAEREQFVGVWTRWCDHPESNVECGDWMALVKGLAELGRGDEALARAVHAMEAYPAEAAPWDAAARLHEARGEPAACAKALAGAAERLRGAESAARWVQAAAWIQASDPQRAAALLRRAIEQNPSSGHAHAELVRSATRLEAWAEVETHAARALFFELPREERFATAMAGGRAAHALGHLESAAEFFTEAVQRAPQSAEALEAQAEALRALGDLAGARRALEQRAALPVENPKRAEQRAVIGLALEANGEHDAALRELTAALAEQPALHDAHAAVVRLHRRAGRAAEAVRACEAWAAVCRAGPERARRQLEAAQIELESGAPERAEAQLRASLAADPAEPRAHQLLVELLSAAGRVPEVLEVSAQALERIAESGPERSAIALQRGRAFEASGGLEAAAETYRSARQDDPRAGEACLAEARLLREAGRARDAQRALESFVRDHPEPDDPGLARALVAQGHLLADELGDPGRAVDCYERAVALEPTCSEARLRLARLLGERPDRERDSLEHHRVLLAENPVEPGLLADLMALTRRREDAPALGIGAALLRALGIESEDGAAEPPAVARLPLAIGRGWALDSALEERLRGAARLAKNAWPRVLPAAAAEPEVDAAPAAESGADALRSRAAELREAEIAAFRSELRDQEAALTAPGLLSLPVEELGRWLIALVRAAAETDPARLDVSAAALLPQLGFWARRRLQQELEGVRLADVEQIDFAAWRAELQARAAAAAIDHSGTGLEIALQVLSESSEPRRITRARTPGDWRAAVNGSRAARSLVSRIAGLWCARLAGR